MAPPPPSDLRVLCRKLASIPQAQLPHAVPLLTKHIIHCKDVLSSPQEQKAKDDSSQSAQLVHKLRTSLTTLLNGRSREGRFAAIGLIKAVVDVGGWEILHVAKPWVGGLLSVVQKGDPFPAKELAILALTKIYMAVQPFQTLVREIATPTVPEFIKACLQLIKPSASGQTPAAPLNVAETILDAFSTLLPLYPTTLRPFSAQIRSAVRGYLAPTLSDDLLVPQSMQRAARKLAISLHCVAAKSGGSDEWAKLLDSLLRELHATADQILRAVDESWEGTSGYHRQRVGPEGEPTGGNGSGDQLPPWSGLGSGAERLVGIFNHLADCLRYPTKVAVVIPVGALMDAVSRVCLIARLYPKSQTWDQAVETNAAISREEKDELWSVIPDIHLSALTLVSVMLQRFGQGMAPMVPEVLDHLVRVFKSDIANPTMRAAGYKLLNSLLTLAGPTMSKATVGMLEPLLAACCRDLQENAGFLRASLKPPTPSSKNGPGKKNNSLANADLFLQPQASAADVSVTLDTEHEIAANTLLASLLSSLPQHHLKPTLRGLLDKTAILTRNRGAMISSVLNPYKDQRGRMYPSILPHVSQQYPQDQGLEILRCNLRTSSVPGNLDMLATVTEIEQEDGEDDEDEQMDEAEHNGEEVPPNETLLDILHPAAQSQAANAKVDLPIQSNPFEAKAQAKPNAFDVSAATKTDSTTKRKLEEPDAVPSKRQEMAKPAVATLPEAIPATDVEENDDSDSDVSVHLNMELDGDDGDDDDDE
ncbi:hypothetical protein QQS21_007336 [Conoideocrella luteorostrata]|uniref:Pre-rRNA-processing protein RIX1 n=1 Tax=Conoideocrella luteorostrata TaxID=1105319 RepID=A0AAJ0CNA8_9HYPO|nr:hypothetical protein QQS21_007336 [Conoideocrella luteorostrata]